MAYNAPSVRVLEEIMSTVGFVDGLRGSGYIEGWVIHLDDKTGKPSGGCMVRLLCDGTCVGHVLANESRVDAAEAFNAPRHCGFSYLPPKMISRGIPHHFQFFDVVHDLEIQGSPCIVTLVVHSREQSNLREMIGVANAERGRFNVQRLKNLQAVELIRSLNGYTDGGREGPTGL
jgi:hypothetical protein